jgi:hypothetical protein
MSWSAALTSFDLDDSQHEHTSADGDRRTPTGTDDN